MELKEGGGSLCFHRGNRDYSRMWLLLYNICGDNYTTNTGRFFLCLDSSGAGRSASRMLLAHATCLAKKKKEKRVDIEEYIEVSGQEVKNVFL